MAHDFGESHCILFVYIGLSYRPRVIYTEILGIHRRFVPTVAGPALLRLLISVALVPTTPEAVLTYY